MCPAFKKTLEEEGELSIGRESYTIPEFINQCRTYNGGVVCPYFANRRLLHTADIIVGSYNYVLDPKCAGPLGAILDQNTLLIIDEAHNLEYAACDAMSMHLSYKLVVDCEQSIHAMSASIAHSARPPPPPFSPDRSFCAKSGQSRQSSRTAGSSSLAQLRQMCSYSHQNLMQLSKHLSSFVRTAKDSQVIKGAALGPLD